MKKSRRSDLLHDLKVEGALIGCKLFLGSTIKIPPALAHAEGTRTATI